MIFLEKSLPLDVFWPKPWLQANHGTVQKNAIFPQPSNQKQLKWGNTAYVNKWSFTFKMKLCVFRVTKTQLCMKVIRIFNTQPVKKILRARWRVNKHGDPIFLLHFFNVDIINVNHAKFQKKFDSRTISRGLP